jgi:predicted acylesterase/phospholipase RssA
MRLKNSSHVALVLSGGGLKAAAFHVGVCMALQEKGFYFAGGTPDHVERYTPNHNKVIRTYVGSSAGAIVASFLASGYPIEVVRESLDVGARGESKRHVRGRLKPITYKDIFTINGRSIAGVLPSLFKSKSMMANGIEAFIRSGFKLNGIFTSEGVEAYLREHVLANMNNFSDLGVDFFVIATQLNHSRKAIFGKFAESYKDKEIKYANYATVSQAVAASSSLPPVFAPYSITNDKGKQIQFFDGEIRDTLSTHVAADHGADLVISSYSMHPYHYTSALGSLADQGIPVIIYQALCQVIQQKINKHIDHRRQVSALLSEIESYLKTTTLTREEQDKVTEIILKVTGHHRDVRYLYIHPDPRDHQMFLADHFSLNPEVLSYIIKVGFKAALSTLRKAKV